MIEKSNIIKERNFVMDFGIETVFFNSKNEMCYITGNREKCESILDNLTFYLLTPFIPIKIIDSERTLHIKEQSEYYILNALIIESIFRSIQENEDFAEVTNLSNDLKRKLDSLCVCWNNMKSFEKTLVEEFLREYSLEFLMFTRKFESINRSKLNRNLASDILHSFRQKSFLFDQFKQSSIVIYGAGEIGKLFFKILKNKHYKVVCFIDEHSSSDKFENTPILKLSQLNSCIYDFDLIVITPIYDFETITLSLREYTNKKIISLREIVNYIGD